MTKTTSKRAKVGERLTIGKNNRVRKLFKADEWLTAKFEIPPQTRAQVQRNKKYYGYMKEAVPIFEKFLKDFDRLDIKNPSVKLTLESICFCIMRINKAECDRIHPKLYEFREEHKDFLKRMAIPVGLATIEARETNLGRNYGLLHQLLTYTLAEHKKTIGVE